MKVLSIGRSDSCNIVIHDPEMLVSRKHALLKLYYTGKMEIVDMSTNGTFVNGIAIQKNKPCVVTRKDVVTFARVKQLDWALVPNYRRATMALSAALTALIILLIAIASWPSGDKPSFIDGSSSMPVMKADSSNSKNKDAGNNGSNDSLTFEDIRNAFRQPEKKKAASSPGKEKGMADADSSNTQKEEDGKEQAEGKSKGSDSMKAKDDAIY